MAGTYVNLAGFNAEMFDRFESFNRFLPSANQFDQASPAVLSIRRTCAGALDLVRSKYGGTMECKSRVIANVVLLQVEGRIDHPTSKAFESALSPYLDGCTGEEKKLLLDCTGLVYISSAGLAVLMTAAKRCRKQNGKIVLASLQPRIQEIFQISRFDKVFEVFPTVRAALENISPAAASAYGDR